MRIDHVHTGQGSDGVADRGPEIERAGPVMCSCGRREPKASCASQQDVTHRALHVWPPNRPQTSLACASGSRGHHHAKHIAARERGHAGARPRDASQGRVAPPAVPAAALRRRLARPRQHRLRGAADERRSRLQQRRLRLRRRHLLHRLRAVRGAEQPDPRARRRAPLDRAHHDHVGHLVGRDDVRVRRHELLRAALPARRRGSRFLAGHHLLPRQLVSGEGASPRRFVVHARDSPVDRRRRTARRLHSRARRLARSARLAVAVLARRHAGRRARLRRSRLSHGLARQGRSGSNPNNAAGSPTTSRASSAPRTLVTAWASRPRSCIRPCGCSA